MWNSIQSQMSSRETGTTPQGGIYNLPSHLSPGARDLIPRMLLVDPLKRITIPEIRCSGTPLKTVNMTLPLPTACLELG